MTARRLRSFHRTGDEQKGDRQAALPVSDRTCRVLTLRLLVVRGSDLVFGRAMIDLFATSTTGHLLSRIAKSFKMLGALTRRRIVTLRGRDVRQARCVNSSVASTS